MDSKFIHDRVAEKATAESYKALNDPGEFEPPRVDKKQLRHTRNHYVLKCPNKTKSIGGPLSPSRDRMLKDCLQCPHHCGYGLNYFSCCYPEIADEIRELVKNL